jgi:hypothetical protein
MPITAGPALKWVENNGNIDQEDRNMHGADF